MNGPNAEIKVSKYSWSLNNVPLHSPAASAWLQETSAPEPRAGQVSTVFT